MELDNGVGLVFIHGGCHSASSWTPTIEALAAQRRDLDALAIDLPGRGGVPGDLATLTLEACIASVVNAGHSVSITHPDELARVIVAMID